jgi:hypothetical protein
MWDSVCDNWWDRVEAIEQIPDVHVEKRRQAFHAFWKRKRENWERQLCTKLAEFKAEKERLWRYTIKEIIGFEIHPQVCLSGWEKSLNNAIDEQRIVDGRKLFDLQTEFRKASRENRPVSEISEIYRKIQDCEAAMERAERALIREYEDRKKLWQAILAYYRECILWVSTANSKLERIQARFTQKLRKIEKVQEREFNELFPFCDDTDSEVPDQETEDLNTAIAVALASHSVTKSAADYPSLRGYGDFVENTQLEKNLSGIRGLEAVQVSSHRGPPTDRPPDKPPP